MPESKLSRMSAAQTGTKGRGQLLEVKRTMTNSVSSRPVGTSKGYRRSKPQLLRGPGTHQYREDI